LLMQDVNNQAWGDSLMILEQQKDVSLFRISD
jgi:hypothetical protein